jgi:DNA-(apurinic or apyrimidinic site) lyase
LVVKKEPEYQEMEALAQRYPPGAFMVLMVAAGLNDFQLKGKAEIAYWPPLRRHLETLPIPNSPNNLKQLLGQFYQKERLNNMKLDRLRRFMESSLAEELWNKTPRDVAAQLKNIWHQVAIVMGQKPSDKTIAFSAKTLGIGLLLLNETGFDFAGIPVPVDLRVRNLTPFLTTDDRVQEFWNEVLIKLRTTQPHLTHLHLDSLLWQYAGASDKRAYLIELGINREMAERINQTFETLKL